MAITEDNKINLSCDFASTKFRNRYKKMQHIMREYLTGDRRV